MLHLPVHLHKHFKENPSLYSTRSANIKKHLKKLKPVFLQKYLSRPFQRELRFKEIIKKETLRKNTQSTSSMNFVSVKYGRDEKCSKMDVHCRPGRKLKSGRR